MSLEKTKKNGHPAYIYAKIGNDYKFIGITHSEITDGIRNVKLDKNPNPKDKKTAFARPKSEKGRTNEFKAKERDWKLTKSDKKKLDKIKTQSKKQTELRIMHQENGSLLLIGKHGPFHQTC